MRKIFFSGAVLAASLLLGACGGPESPTPAPSSQAGHNAADVAFAQQMIPHHQQALEMAKMVPSRSSDPKVVDLAGRIDRAQDPEIRQMQGWLKAWGVAATSHAMPGGHEMSGDHPMTGMMSDADMKSLDAAKGPAFDRSWLDMMVKHHQGAVEMAKTELAQGSDAGAKALARKIIEAQQAEIAEMQGLLKG
ncbi:uncharacterized protein (DUF305 family) [Amycolatopsis echigonensis]|uniref:Uncharacterized protein (DUF305 family) n=1 Tax=Amycolatopsis echigonensis TaxID=2576905 RepID=A0A2N3WQJ1_9PSEU|nr:DUF305 domain-containing protein [Amycolatopsis niigatensis]PKV96141.1 uncharacterized protein (DUF305 family) [Amycolatopsis niigatensis]